jgi:hypothetical protein
VAGLMDITRREIGFDPEAITVLAVLALMSLGPGTAALAIMREARLCPRDARSSGEAHHRDGATRDKGSTGACRRRRPVPCSKLSSRHQTNALNRTPQRRLSPCSDSAAGNNDVLRAARAVDEAGEEPNSELMAKVVLPVLSIAEREFDRRRAVSVWTTWSNVPPSAID